ncbi:MAG: hypothetical protein OHK0015_00580 [Chloroflexi bacterium OHK40]
MEPEQDLLGQILEEHRALPYYVCYLHMVAFGIIRQSTFLNNSADGGSVLDVRACFLRESPAVQPRTWPRRMGARAGKGPVPAWMGSRAPSRASGVAPGRPRLRA